MPVYVETPTVTLPFPGLRPFRRDEFEIFFGREEHVAKLAEMLQAHHFVAVVGPSGCGKSSLVTAGLLPALAAGHAVDIEGPWYEATIRPGDRPFSRLAEAIVASEVLPDHTNEHLASRIGFLDAELRRGPLGLIEALDGAETLSGGNLLIVVDQFEEIFRFRHEESDQEADAFMALLLETVRQAEQRKLPIYVMLTMRSDYLGACNQFSGLPEAISDSQFLTPRPNREQRHAAIVGPASMFGGEVEPALVNRLLNDMGDDPDQLPIMQHALMRMWSLKSLGEQHDHVDQESASTSEQDEQTVVLTTDIYDEVGGWQKALSNHADEALDGLGDDRERERVAEMLFRSLTHRGPNQNDVRRPVSVQEVADVAGVSTEIVKEVVNAFRRSDRCFLTPGLVEGDSRHNELADDDILDISHESLIRNWHRLRAWAKEEGESAANYGRLEDAARRKREGKTAYLQSPELDLALKWRDETRPTVAWARRYGTDFQLAMQYLKDSQAEKQRLDAEAESQRHALAREQARADQHAEKARRTRRFTAAIGTLAALLAVALSVAIKQTTLAKNNERKAIKQTTLAKNNEREAIKQTDLANTQTALAKANADLATYNAALATNRQAAAQRQNARTNVVRGAELADQGATELGVKSFSEEALKAKRRIKEKANAIAKADEKAKARDDAALEPKKTSGEIGALARRFESSWRKYRDRPVVHKKQVIAAAEFSPDGKTIVTVSAVRGGKAKLWDVQQDGTVVDPRPVLVTGDVPLTDVAVTGEGENTIVAIANHIGEISLWDSSARRIGEFADDIGRHTRVNALAFSPDGEKLVSGDDDGRARIWDVASRKINQDLPVEDFLPVETVAFRPDGEVIATGSAFTHDGKSRIQLWDVRSGERKGDGRQFDGFIRNIVFHPGGRALLISGDHSELWQIDDNFKLNRRSFEFTDSSHGAAFTPDGNTVIAASGRFVQVLNFATGSPLARPLRHNAEVNSVAVSPDGSLALTSCGDDTARLWQLKPRSLKTLKWQPGNKPIALAFNSNEMTVIAVKRGGRWVDSQLRRHTGPMSVGGFAADGKSLLTGQRFTRHFDEQQWPSIATDGNAVVAMDYKGRVLVWNEGDKITKLGLVPPEKKGEKFGAKKIQKFAAQNKEKDVALTAGSAASAIRIRVRDKETGEWEFIPANRNPVALNGSVVLLATNTEKLIIWDRNKETIGQLKCDDVRALAISQDTNRIAVLGADKKLQVFTLNKGEATFQDLIVVRSDDSDKVSQKQNLAFGPTPTDRQDRGVIACSTDHEVRLYDIDLGAPMSEPIVVPSLVNALAFSPDGRWLYIAGDDGNIYLWEVPVVSPEGVAISIDAVAESRY